MKTENHFLIRKIVVIFTLVFCLFVSDNAHAQNQDPVGAVTFPLIEASTAATAIEAPVSSTANTATAASTAANQATGLAEYSWSSFTKNTLDAAAYTMAQKLLTKLTDNTVAWIKGGFHDSPNFNVDVKETAIEVADEIAGGLVLSIKNLSVCDFTLSYKDDLVTAIEQSAKKRPYTYQQKAACPFPQNYVFKASDFYEDFNKGGWEMMGGALSDGGNPYGVQMLTVQERAARENEAKTIANQKLSWSNGFTDIIDVTNCKWPDGYWAYEGGYNKATMDEAGGMGTYSKEEADAINQKTMETPTFKETQRKSCKTTTPGKVVGDQLTKTLGVNMDRIGFADNMNKMVSAFINFAMEEAVRGVFGKGDKTTASGGVIPTTTPVVHNAPVLSALFASNVTSTAAELTGTLNFTGPTNTNLRVWFIVKNADSSILWEKPVEVPNILARPYIQNISVLIDGLDTINNTYIVTTAYTTGGPALILPSATSLGNGKPGNGSFSFPSRP